MKNVAEMKTADVKAIASEVLAMAREGGAEHAAVHIETGYSTSITVRRSDPAVPDRSPESISSDSGSLKISFRAYLGKRSALGMISKLDPSALRPFIQRVIETSRVRPEDPFEGLPEAQHLATNVPSLELYSPDCLFLNTATKKNMAAAMEAAAFAVSDKIVNSEGAEFGGGKSITVYGNSHGFVEGYAQSSCGMGVSVIASQGKQMQRGFWGSSSVRRSTLQSPAEIGRQAGTRALRLLGARQVPTQKVPVVFDPDTAAQMLGHIAEVLDADEIFSKQSFLVNKLGEQIACSKLQITDDPFMPWGLGSRPFGAQGIPMSKRSVVADGRLQCYFVDTKGGRKLKMAANGGGASNLYINAGDTSPADIIKSVKNGLYLTGLLGHGFQPVTGDYSFAAEGLWIENGELAFPVNEITVAGNLKEMLPGIEAIGNDLEFRSAVNAPTLLVGSMMVAS